PVLEQMMAAVHRYEGTVNQVLGDGIMALFGAPVAHEDHAVRACYAALAMQEAIRRYSAEMRRTHGVEVQIRVGLNSGVVVARALSPFVGRQPEVEALQQALARAAAGQGQVVALIGEPGVGKSRLVYEFLQAHYTRGWLRLESSSVSYGKATTYLPVCDLLKAYCHIEDRDDLRTVRAQITGQSLTLDDALQDTMPAALALFESLQ